MYLLTSSPATFDAFATVAEQLGYRLEDVYRGKGERTWRFRVHKMHAAAPHWADGLAQRALPGLGQPEQGALF